MQPGNIKNYYFKKNSISMVLNLTLYVRNVISFFYKQKKKKKRKKKKKKKKKTVKFQY